MYDVMIVDDEEPVLESFSFILEKGVDSFRLCGKARSGLEAIQMADVLKPDVIFMDIQMPGIDGLEAVRQIREENKRVLIILATAYERFDIAREAISLNVHSYLVKPVTRRKITDELIRARASLDQQAARRRMLLQQTRTLEESVSREELDFVRSLSRPSSEEELRYIREKWNLGAKRGRIVLLHKNGTQSMGEKQKCYCLIKEKLLFKTRCFLSYSGDRGVFFFPLEKQLTPVPDIIRTVLRDLSFEDITMGVGGIYPIEESYLSYEEAMEPFALREEDERLYELEQIGRILELVERGEREEVKEDLTFFAESVFLSREFPVALGKMTSLFSMILETLGFYSTENQRVLPIYPAEEIMVLKSREEWEAWFHHGMDRILKAMVPLQKKELPPPLRRAMDFIQEEYGGQIYLGSVAEECGVSASYLSRLFSENLKTPFVDYLNRFRVDRAVEYLKKGTTVKEAAFRVGFGDPNYFSKIFRKYKGISPSEL